MKQLIVNADDYGRSANVSRGIRHAHLHGIVTSTTCMMNFPTTVDDIAVALRETPKLGLGVHLVLTAGAPLSDPAEIPTLVGSDGAFPTYHEVLARVAEMNERELELEWTRQIDAFITQTGRAPTHLDSHHHVAFWGEAPLTTLLSLANRYGCAIRVPRDVSGQWRGLPAVNAERFAPALLAASSAPHPDAFYAGFYDEGATEENLRSIIGELDDGTAELMCHPGFVDADLIATSGYSRPREIEMDLLTDPKMRELLAVQQIERITFVDLDV